MIIADRIRKMTNEELAIFLSETKNSFHELEQDIHLNEKEREERDNNAKTLILNWLLLDIKTFEHEECESKETFAILEEECEELKEKVNDYLNLLFKVHGLSMDDYENREAIDKILNTCISKLLKEEDPFFYVCSEEILSIFIKETIEEIVKFKNE